MTESRTTEHADRGDRIQKSTNDVAQEGALGRMQAEALPKVGEKPALTGQGQATPGSDGKVEPKTDIKTDSSTLASGGGESLPGLELVDDGDKTRAAKKAPGGAKAGVSHEALKPKPAGDAKPAPASGSGAEASEPLVTELSRSKDFDPAKPTALVLDDFKKSPEALPGRTTVQHGDLSSGPAEKAGFNTIRMQFKDDNPAGSTDFSKHLTSIADKIEKGELPLGKGDVVNVSLGNADPTFEQASKFVGFPVTRENLAGERQHILNTMGDISKDPTRSAEDRATAARVVNTNAAIDRIQGKGVEVIQAAGNAGKDQFSWDFMNAKTQLSSNKASGAADTFSASHSLATPGEGVIPVHYRNEANMLDPTPLKSQRGNLELGDTGIKVPAKGLPAFGGNDRVLDRENFQFDKKLATAPAVGGVGDINFDKNLTMPHNPAAAKQLGDTAAMPADKFNKGGWPGFVEMVKPLNLNNLPTGDSLPAGQDRVAGVYAGTSFANNGYLKENLERLQREKAGR